MEAAAPVDGPAIGLVSPGAMGAVLGGLLVRAGHTVRWASDGRSGASVRRAAGAGLVDAGTTADLAAASDVVLSIVPPHAALDTARALAGFAGIYADCNAIAPATAVDVAAVVEAGGATFVDGGIVGLPPEAAGTTRLYLSGEEAPAVAALFAATVCDAVVLDGPPTAASALKMAYAAWSKGTAAMLLATHATATAHGVVDALEAEWALSAPSLPARLQAARAAADEKGWRWVAEMEEIAATFAAAAQPPGFHEAAADVFRRHSG